MLARLILIIRDLKLDPQRMRKNLDLSGGLIMAEAVMLTLGATLGRQHAHDVVYDAAQAAFVENKAFGDLLSADPRVTERLDSAAIAKLMDPIEYCGLSAMLAREAVQRVRDRRTP
jgi:adenylosuccinate lyase